MPQDIEVYIRLIASCCRQLVELRSEKRISESFHLLLYVIPSISLLLEVKILAFFVIDGASFLRLSTASSSKVSDAT